MTDLSHLFIFKPGIWIGEGTISFSMSPTKVKFFTRWEVVDLGEKGSQCRQAVELQGVDEHVINQYSFTKPEELEFEVVLENELVEKVKGHGFIENNKIAWEFREGGAFEGFEVYELGENGLYHMHAEYASSDQFRTVIDGQIWKKHVDK